MRAIKVHVWQSHLYSHFQEADKPKNKKSTLSPDLSVSTKSR